MKIKNSDHWGRPFVYISDFFGGVKVKFFCFISKQIAFLVSLNTLVPFRMDKNILKINCLFFCENQKFRSQGGTLCIPFRFYRGCQS